MSIQKTPILISAISLYIGGIFSYFYRPTFDALIGLLATSVFILLIISISNILMKLSSFRMIGLGVISFFVGSIYFHVNDFRDSNLWKIKVGQEETFSVKVIEASPVSLNAQNLVVSADTYVSNGLIQPLSGKFLVRIQDSEKIYSVDDELIVHGTLLPIKNAGNPGEFDAESYYEKKGIAHRMFVLGFQIEKFNHTTTLTGLFTEWRNYLAELMEHQLKGEFLAISKALILGDKSDLDVDTKNVFTNTGSMHVLAVSGLHVGLLLAILNGLLAQFSFLINKRSALILSIFLIWGYGFLTGAAPSVMRAVFMFTMIALGTLLERKNSGLNTLLITAALLFFIDPWVVFDIGFQLSFAAMLGIFLVYPGIERFISPKQKWIKWFWEGTAVGLAATIFTCPLSLFWFYQFPNYFLLANLGVMVFGFFVLLLGLIFLISAPIPVISTIVALVFSFSIIGLLVWVNWIDGMPGAVSSGFQLTLYTVIVSYIIIFAWTIDLKYRFWKPFLIVSTVALFVFVSLDRMTVLKKEQFLVLNANQFIVILKSEKQAVAFYEPRYGHADKIPTQLAAYERFTGTKLKIHSLHTDVRIAFKGKHYEFMKDWEGWKINLNGNHYFFQTKGVPDADRKSKVILSSGLQSYLDDTKEQFCFKRSL